MSSTGSAPVDGTQLCPPSALRSSSPLAGTTSLTVVVVVPAATQTEVLRQVALWSTPRPVGTVARDQVCPPSELTETAPSPCPLLMGT